MRRNLWLYARIESDCHQAALPATKFIVLLPPLAGPGEARPGDTRPVDPRPVKIVLSRSTPPPGIWPRRPEPRDCRWCHVDGALVRNWANIDASSSLPLQGTATLPSGNRPIWPVIRRINPKLDVSASNTCHSRVAVRERPDSSWAFGGIRADRHLGPLPKAAWPSMYLHLRR